MKWQFQFCSLFLIGVKMAQLNYAFATETRNRYGKFDNLANQATERRVLQTTDKKSEIKSAYDVRGETENVFFLLFGVIIIIWREIRLLPSIHMYTSTC